MTDNVGMDVRRNIDWVTTSFRKTVLDTTEFTGSSSNVAYPT